MAGTAFPPSCPFCRAVLLQSHSGATTGTVAVNVTAVTERGSIGIGNFLAGRVPIARQIAAGYVLEPGLVGVAIAASETVTDRTSILVLTFHRRCRIARVACMVAEEPAGWSIPGSTVFYHVAGEVAA